MTRLQIVLTNLMKTTASCSLWRYHRSSVNTLVFFPKGQLQQEDPTLQLWQEERCKYSSQHQCNNVCHWHLEDWRSWPRLHTQVPIDSRMVLLLENLLLEIVVFNRYDYRLKYLNLKKARSQNAINIEDLQKLWIPFLVFDNTEKNEATWVNNHIFHILPLLPRAHGTLS